MARTRFGPPGKPWRTSRPSSGRRSARCTTPAPGSARSRDLTPCDIERDAAAIGQIPGVAGVTVRDGVVVVTTERVTIEHRGAVHDMGTFRLELSPDLGVRVFAAEPPPDVRVAWIHPHVQADRPCLGNARVGIEKLLGELQLVSTTEVLLRFLAAYDPETAYCDLSAWPTHP